MGGVGFFHFLGEHILKFNLKQFEFWLLCKSVEVKLQKSQIGPEQI